MTLPRITFQAMVETLSRMAFLPGFDRLDERAYAEYYRHLGTHMPHELDRAISTYLTGPSEFFPSPGKLLELMSAHRTSLGRDWDTVERALLAEASGQPVEAQLEAPTGRESLEAEAGAFFRAHPELLPRGAR